MNAAFADSYYYLALLSESDAAHQEAVQLARASSGRTVTTAWVLAEVADALASPGLRFLFLALYERLRGNPRVTIVPPCGGPGLADSWRGRNNVPARSL